MALAAGTRLGPYEVRDQIGAGGMGEVYRATDTRLDRTVAIKVLPEQVGGDPRSGGVGAYPRLTSLMMQYQPEKQMPKLNRTRH